MNLLIDTSVWSEALRRKNKSVNSEDTFLFQIIKNEEEIFLTGIILQEILTGIKNQKLFDDINNHLRFFNFINPTNKDHILAAQLRNDLAKKGITVASIDVLIAQIAISHNLTLATYDSDFEKIALNSKLKIINFEKYHNKI
ncbi:PIN domain-containing protein [Leptospira meyeri]|uniref:type II toxin-antitoxin system VapC family toxin n=1 Tax=Leptospira meyeri TaxID=29508 RepID=UPI000C2B1BCD|nr:PIN domain-containing protein [Leptospira meyeri]PKA23706.1 VapC toxin family PIN domain ribonuclease [Leptospira sp. mixed culture ATI2-C-A1]TGM22793.1 PIN domain nuclease [Leptospira meyeri]